MASENASTMLEAREVRLSWRCQVVRAGRLLPRRIDLRGTLFEAGMGDFRVWRRTRRKVH